MTDQEIIENMDILEILERLPHRYPFVMVDRILEVVPGERVVGLKNVTINEPFFQGHFPEKPVMPGVLMLEGMAQVGGIMAYCMGGDAVKDKLLYFVGIDKAKFRKVVGPGDQIIYRLDTFKSKRNIIMMSAKAFVEDKLVCEAQLKASFG